MGPHALLTTEKIPKTQGLWQACEIVANAVILLLMLVEGNSVLFIPAILWQAFEVVMNTWILITMVKVGFNKKTPPGTRLN